MKTSFLGFNQNKFISLGLTFNHMIILDWLIYFAHSGKQTIIETKKEYQHYYWVYYKKVFDDLPGLPFKSNQKLNFIFKELSGEHTSNTEKYPLIKIVKNTLYGRKVGFAIRENVLEWLREAGEEKMNNLFGEEYKNKDKKIKSLNKNVFNIINELLNLKKYDGTPIFRDKKPLDEYTYTKGLLHFQEKVLLIYSGMFIRTYKQDVSFLSKNKSYNIEENLKKLNTIKNDWVSIKDMLVLAAKCYGTWFDPENQPINKDWLRKNLDSWIFDSIFNGSLFLACMDGPAYPIREISAEKIYNSIPSNIRKIFIPLYKNIYDGFTFWNKVKSMYGWIVNNKKYLKEKDSNFNYWYYNDEQWLNEYKEWLVSFADTLYLNHLGTGNKTWAAWINYGKEKHELML